MVGKDYNMTGGERSHAENLLGAFLHQLSDFLWRGESRAFKEDHRGRHQTIATPSSLIDP